MPIDPRMVKWDDAASVPSIDPRLVNWDEPEAKKGGALKTAANILAGGVRGAGSIGATILWPLDKAQDMYYGDREAGLTSLVTGEKPLSRNQERRKAMDEALGSMGADTDSMAYKGGKLATEIAGTLPVGGIAGKLISKVPGLASVGAATSSGGFNLGAAATGNKIADAASRIAGGAINGGLTAGAVNPEDAGVGAILGGAIPAGGAGLHAAGKAAGKALGVGSASPEVIALAKRANELGIDIPADRLVNSNPLNAVAASLKYVPLSGRAGTERAMESQLNTALSRTFGQESDNITMALRKGERELGGQFDDFLKNNTLKVDDEFLNELVSHLGKAKEELGPIEAKVIENQVNAIVDKTANGMIDGQAAYNIKKTLDRIGNRNSNEAWYAGQLKKSLMGALNRSVGPEKAEAFSLLRKQYGNMMDLQPLAKNGAEGEISVARLANMKNINNADLQEIADIAAQFVKPREGAHGAAQRVTLGGLAGGFSYTNPAAAPVVAGVMGTARGANMLLNSKMMKRAVIGSSNSTPSRYGLLGRNPEALRALSAMPGLLNAD